MSPLSASPTAADPNMPPGTSKAGYGRDLPGCFLAKRRPLTRCAAVNPSSSQQLSIPSGHPGANAQALHARSALQSAQQGFQSEARTLASTFGEMARVSVNISDSPSSHPAESSCSRGSLGVQLCGGSGERPAAATTLRAVQCTACNSQASR